MMAMVVQQQAAISQLASVSKATSSQAATSTLRSAFIGQSPAARRSTPLIGQAPFADCLRRKGGSKDLATSRRDTRRKMAEAALGLFGAPAKGKVGEDLPKGYENDDPSQHMPKRRAGILLHPTSLPGPYGVGEFGEDAFKFIDWLKTTGCTVWQVRSTRLLSEILFETAWLLCRND